MSPGNSTMLHANKLSSSSNEEELWPDEATPVAAAPMLPATTPPDLANRSGTALGHRKLSAAQHHPPGPHSTNPLAYKQQSGAPKPLALAYKQQSGATTPPRYLAYKQQSGTPQH